MKSKRIVNRKILDAARGEHCTLQIATVCNGNPETTVAAHMQFEGGVMGGKESDTNVAFSCSSCHLCLDQYQLPPDERWYYMGRGLVRTWRRLIEKGVIKI